MVRMGDILGLYKALNEHGAMTSAELAVKTKVDERYAREWLSHQASSGYVDYDPASGKSHPSARTSDGVLANVDSPVYLQGAFDLAVAMAENQPKVLPSSALVLGSGWGDQTQCRLSARSDASSGPVTTTISSSFWLPALDGVAAKLESGAKRNGVADLMLGPFGH